VECKKNTTSSMRRTPKNNLRGTELIERDQTCFLLATHLLLTAPNTEVQRLTRSCCFGFVKHIISRTGSGFLILMSLLVPVPHRVHDTTKPLPLIHYPNFFIAFTLRAKGPLTSRSFTTNSLFLQPILIVPQKYAQRHVVTTCMEFSHDESTLSPICSATTCQISETRETMRGVWWSLSHREKRSDFSFRFLHLHTPTPCTPPSYIHITNLFQVG
jgi:hypothetical protein